VSHGVADKSEYSEPRGKMKHYELSGYYTYRSFINNPEPVGDFNKLRFAEAELFLNVAPDGRVTGTLAFPPGSTDDNKALMDVSGRVTNWSTSALEFEGVGRANTETDAFHYIYRGEAEPPIAQSVGQRLAIVGTVMRAKPHGSAQAGVTASFVAVKREFVRPRTIPGVALIPEAVKMLASRRHRLQHNVWHTVRARWWQLSSNTEAVGEIQKRGWWPTRPPFTSSNRLDLENGSGEDFLFMHRRMIQMLSKVYSDAGKSLPKGWSALPPADAPQLVYKATDDGKAFTLDQEASGFMVPPPEIADEPFDELVKSPAFFNSAMRPTLALYQSQRWLSGLTLGQLGNLIEWSIHGWMHNRWGDVAYDANGQAIGRSDLFDIDPKWDGADNDDLLDFYSSHVHPLFWRLHGWIDNRIEDWAKAHPEVERAELSGVAWFAVDGKNVVAEPPFSWPETNSAHGGGHHHHSDSDIKDMEEVLSIMKKALTPPPSPDSKARLAAEPSLKPARQAFRELTLGLSLS
jgi:hypothetical protein